MNESRVERFYLLDIARGLASLSVVIWHFQHFYYPPGKFLAGEKFQRSQQPFYELLSPFYEQGYLAVQFFFVLSGFIFHWLYSQRIASGEETARSFFILRFSRLYPLHVLTLIIVAALQIVANQSLDHYITYPVNNLKHFLLNLGLVQHWGFQNWFSFNAPSWSISAEIFAYIVFFSIMRLGGTRIWHSIAVILLAFFAYAYNAALAEVVLCFFVGCITFSVYQSLIQHYLKFSTAVSLILLTSVYLISYTELLVTDITLIKSSFPFIVLLLAVIQNQLQECGRHFALIGDLTYSTYLLHFPLQLAILLLVQTNLVSTNIDSTFFIAFFVILLLLSYACFHYFERPAQRYIRNRFL